VRFKLKQRHKPAYALGERNDGLGSDPTRDPRDGLPVAVPQEKGKFVRMNQATTRAVGYKKVLNPGLVIGKDWLSGVSRIASDR